MSQASKYFDFERSAASVRDGTHRSLVGGMWDEIGRLQFDYLETHGLKPEMFLLDVGCGCLRGGVHFIEFLDAGHYYGIDISRELLNVGYDVELDKLGLKHKLPRENLYCTDTFEARHFGIVFDIALAQSVFTHLTLSQVRLCLTRLSDVIRIDGAFYATVFLSQGNHDPSLPHRHSPGGIVSYPAKDPFHFTFDELTRCCTDLPWKIESASDWNHPRDQTMITFVRTQ